MAAKVRCAGSLFVGAWSAQVAGDYAIGSNHVLPTAGAARVRGGLSAADFVRQITVQRLTQKGLEQIGPAVIDLATAEGLIGPRGIDRGAIEETLMPIQGYPDPGDGLRLHLNENTGGCSPRVLEAIRRVQTSDVSTYPSYTALVHACAAHFNVDPEWVLLTNGLDEGILMAAVGHIARARAFDAETIVPLPAFDPYPNATRRRRRNAGADSAASGIRVPG